MTDQFTLQTFSNGSVSVFDSQYGQTMHSLIGPLREARAVYLEQAKVRQRLLKERLPSLVIWDVGLGIGTNALATLVLLEELASAGRGLHLISFENNLKGIHFALKNPGQLPFLNRYHQWMHELLQNRRIEKNLSNGRHLIWQLLEGDFNDQISQAAPPEIIFYDFYSPQSCPHLWNFQIFQAVFRAASQGSSQPSNPGAGTFLCTYTTSTAARTAMLLAGFKVGKGISTEGKLETTLAATLPQLISQPLGQKWLDHWDRSGHPLPHDIPSNERSLVRQKLSNLLGT